MDKTSARVEQLTLKEKFWTPFQPVLEVVNSTISENALVVEIGPGHMPFPRATEFIDWQQWTGFANQKTHYLDLNKESLPYEDKTVDFIPFGSAKKCREWLKLGILKLHHRSPNFAEELTVVHQFGEDIFIIVTLFGIIRALCHSCRNIQ
jgi:hypothetical protein